MLLETIVGPEIEKPKTASQSIKKKKKIRTRKSENKEETAEKMDEMNIDATTQNDNTTSTDAVADMLDGGKLSPTLRRITLRWETSMRRTKLGRP